MGHIQSLAEFVNLLKRRRWVIGGVLAMGIVLSLLLALAQSKTYEAGAVIQVETPVVSDSGSGSVGSKSARLLQMIEQRLTTRESLIAVIERHGLFADAPGLSVDKKVELLRQSISFQSVAAVEQPTFGTPAGVSALIVTARFGDPDQAARVANDFAQGMLDQSTAGRSQRTREALQFFTTEEQRITSELQALEDEIATFKNQNANVLPTSRDNRENELASLEVEMRRLDQRLVGLRSERTALEKKTNAVSVYKRQIEDMTTEIDVIQQQRNALVGQRDVVAGSLAKTPAVERTLNNYNRHLQQLQSEFDVVTARRAEADTAFRLEQSQRSEHFSLLERAMVPEYAIGGSRKKIAVFGTVASLLLGVGVAFALDLLHPVIRTSAQMKRELDLLPVVTIPEVKIATAVRSGFSPKLLERLKPRPGLPRYTVLAGGMAVLLLLATFAAIT